MKSDSASAPATVIRILLIDDNKNGLNARKCVLEEEGYCVHASSTPEDGLLRFSETNYNLVITDYKMPRVNGAQVIAAMRALKPEIPIIIISGQVDAMGLTEQNTGADALIPKSATEVPQMIRVVSRLLQRKAARKPVKASGRVSSRKRNAS